MHYLVEDLVYHYSEENVWSLPEGIHTVQFNNDVIEMTHKQIYLSYFYWELYRCFPGARIIKQTAITTYFNASTHKNLGGVLVWHVFYEHEASKKWTVWDISKVFYEITNNIYNMTCTRLSRYITSTSLHDLIEILNDKNILAAKEKYLQLVEEVNYTESVVSAEIKKVHSVVIETLYSNPDYLRDNSIKKLCMSGLVNKGQMVQLIGPRGFVQEIDGSVFPYPINVGYAEGLPTLYDSIIESRSASRSSIMNEEPLELSEYFNRKVQLAASVVMTYVDIPGGCSGYITIDYLVEEEDLTLLQGKYHMVNGQPILIWDTIDHLIGTVIKLRTITGCGCEDVQTVCTICLGWSHYIIPPKTNLGFALATPLCALISNTIMSTKHHESSSSSKKLELDINSSKWLCLHDKYPGKLFLTEYATRGNILIRVEAEYVKYLSQILHVDVSELPPSRLTKIPELGITHTNKAGELVGPFDKLKLEISGVGVHLTTQVLAYLKDHGWGSGKGYIEFNLKNWNLNVPVFLIPHKGDNIMIFFNDVKSFIEPEKKTSIKITDFKTRALAVAELINILRRRLNKSNNHEFNIIQVEIFIRSMMMVDYDNKQFALPHPSQDFHFIGLKQVIISRSLTSMIAYQEQFTSLLDINWQINEQKTRHMLDPILRS